MTKKVLYIEADSPLGHIPFNLGYISRLSERADVSLSLVCRKAYFGSAGASPAAIVKEIPHRLYLKKSGGKFISRVFMLLRYLYVRWTVDIAAYDKVICAGYDEMALFFSFIRRPLLLVNHDNVRGLDNAVKRFFLKKISGRHSHIVFEEYIASRMRAQGISNVFVVKHGLSAPFAPAERGVLKAIHERITGAAGEKIILCLSLSSADMQLLDELVHDASFGRLMARHNMLLVVREHRHRLAVDSPNILRLNTLLSTAQYRALFLHSFAVLLPYPDTFRYRVSNVLHECISNNKLCFASDIPALRVYARHMRYPYYYSGVEELVACIASAVEKKVDSATDKYINTDALQTDFSEILTDPIHPNRVKNPVRVGCYPIDPLS
jgi:hypothetical protein